MASSSMTKNLNKTVEESIKEDRIWIFSDIECKADRKVCYTWTTLFQAFQDKYFVVLLQNDATTELSKEIYKNIIKSGLHRATVKTPVLSCPDVIE
jgi:calcineurin-like phosphoesterase family protein